MMRVAYVTILLLVSSLGIAAETRHSGNVVELLIDKSAYGGCMIAIQGYDSPPGCRSKWVSMDCNGSFHDKSAARLMLESAQMAYALGKDFSVMVSDEKKHDGWCVATRAFNLP